jgi:hypothetical protein
VRKQRSERGGTALVVANPDGLVDSGPEYLAVSDFAGARRGQYGLLGFFDQLVGHYDFQLYFWQEIDGVFAAPIELGMAFLAAVAASFKDGHALNSDFDKSIFDRIQLGGLDYRFNLVHGFDPKEFKK